MESAALFIENLLDFSSDLGEGDDEEEDENNNNSNKKPTNETQHPQQETEFNILDSEEIHRSFPVQLEEELEWISNKDAFPSIETFDIISEEPSNNGPKHQSPVSVLENSSSSSCNSLRFPVKARTKKRRRRRSCFSDLSGQQWWWCEPKKAKIKTKSVGGAATTTGMVRKCKHCLAEKTPQWRAGPLGPKTLCNACGVRYKSGRLVPEYRPANSPSYSSKLHSNSHRKILDMRRKKQKMMFPSLGKG